jgi:hypothetical protein
MAGTAWIIVGGTGTGKTTFTKNALTKIHPAARMVFDINNEYPELYNVPFNPDFNKFTLAATKVKNAFIVFEEATMFLRRQGVGENVINILVRKRHTNNTVFLIFHSLRLVPRDLLDLCNFIVIHKTNDEIDTLENKLPKNVIDSYLRIKAADRIPIPNSDKFYSPHEIIPLQAYQ